GALFGAYLQGVLGELREVGYSRGLDELIFSPLGFILVSIFLAIVGGAIAVPMREKHLDRKNPIKSAIVGAFQGGISLGIIGGVLATVSIILASTFFINYFGHPLFLFILPPMVAVWCLLNGGVGGAVGGLLSRPTAVTLPLFCGAASVAGMIGLLAVQFIWKG